MHHTTPRRSASRPLDRAATHSRRVLRGGAVVALLVALGVTTVPVTALAASWGPRTSSYQGVVRVSASGTLTRLASGSKGTVRVCDRYNEGWRVYGYVNWRPLKSATELSSTQLRGQTVETAGCAEGTWTKGWATLFGFWVDSGGCAQVGWPVPDNCTAPVVEVHRP